MEASLSQNAITVLEKRYLKKDELGNPVETPDEMFGRVAHDVASAELIYNAQSDVRAVEGQFHRLMTSLDFLPNSPTLMNAGRELQQLSACFVLPIEDSMESIFQSLKNTALIHKSGGGTGFSFSRLRPKDDMVSSTSGSASGPISFLHVYNAATDAVKQGGTRRGANMAILNVTHPDIVEFINCKPDERTLTNFNISVGITEEFMRAVEAGTDYDLVSPRTKLVVRRIPAREVFDLMVERAWANGEPGIVFIDRINRFNPTPHIGAIESTNPCGEQPLLPYESCNLGSINLAHMVKGLNGKSAVDFEKLERTVQLAVRFLDDVIDRNKYPIPEIERMTKGNRKIGLGVMGFSDLLIKLGLPYNSEGALELADTVMKRILDTARKASLELAQERGAFPNFKGSVYDTPGAPPMRNATLTTIAPTGTLSIIAGCSSGIEPVFALSYHRNILDGQKLLEVNPLFEERARREGFYSEQLMATIAERGSVQGLEDVPARMRALFVTALDISPEWHVKMQAAFQQHTDNAVSKTINFPKEATRDDVRQAFVLAYKEGCKGITIYRNGSREHQVLTTAKPAPERSFERADDAVVTQKDMFGKEQVRMGALTPRQRPDIVTGKTHRMHTGCGNLYVTVNSDEQGLVEIFAIIGKSGGCAYAQCEATTRLVSLALRAGVDIESIMRQLRGIRCPSPAWREGVFVLSCPDAISKVLERYLDGHGEENGASHQQHLGALPADHAPQTPTRMRNEGGQCPECGSLVEYLDGCYLCRSCGYSKCG